MTAVTVVENGLFLTCCVPIALEKENAVADFRKLIGATDPKDAADGTIRKLYADNKGENIVHGSDSKASAKRELALFFPVVVVAPVAEGVDLEAALRAKAILAIIERRSRAGDGRLSGAVEARGRRGQPEAGLGGGRQGRDSRRLFT